MDKWQQAYDDRMREIATEIVVAALTTGRVYIRGASRQLAFQWMIKKAGIDINGVKNVQRTGQET